MSDRNVRTNIEFRFDWSAGIAGYSLDTFEARAWYTSDYGAITVERVEVRAQKIWRDVTFLFGQDDIDRLTMDIAIDEAICEPEDCPAMEAI